MKETPNQCQDAEDKAEEKAAAEEKANAEEIPKIARTKSLSKPPQFPNSFNRTKSAEF